MFLLEYILINLAAVLFTLLVCNIADTNRKTHALRLKRITARYSAALKKCKQTGDFRLPDRNIRGLKRYIGIEAFFEALKELDLEDKQRILLDNSNNIIRILNKEKQPTVHAYFSYMLKDMKIRGVNGGGYGTLMIKFLSDGSVFSRENALKSIYSFGDPEIVELAFTLLSARGIIHNEKLITDGLMTYPGDKEKLAARLMKHFDTLLECYRNSLINYMGLAGIEKYDDILIKRAIKPETSINTICCITRKMNRVKSSKSFRYLVDIERRFREGGDWEPVAIAVTGLAHFPEEKVAKDILKRELISRNWYIRKNSAESLAAIGVTEKDLEDIRASNDKYANEAIHYALTRLENV